MTLMMEGPNVLRGVAGPDAGWAVRLEPGTHWLGRAAGGVQVFDPMIEAHHACLEVDDGGSVTVLQTAGRVPLLVDGDPVDGRTRLPTGSAVEIGASRIDVGSMATSTRSPVGWVLAPQDDSGTERGRFDRDVAEAAAAVRARHLLADGPLLVDVGVADVAFDLDIRDGNGDAIGLGDLPHDAQAIVDRRCRHVAPVRVDLSAVVPMLIVAPDPVVVADAITASLDARDRAPVIVAPAADVDALAGAGRPLLALAHADDESVDDDGEGIPAGCRSALRVGPTWRATWRADLGGHLGRLDQVHARGRSARRTAPTRRQPTPAGRSSLSR